MAVPLHEGSAGGLWPLKTTRGLHPQGESPTTRKRVGMRYGSARTRPNP